MRDFLEFFHLLYLRLFVFFFNTKEEIKVRRTLYKHPLFRAADAALQKSYKNLNPYTLCKQFLLQKGEKEIHTYGETPLTELASFLEKCNLVKEDHFVDLGCGRGRVAFFVDSYFPCSVTGVDCVPRFISLAISTGKSLTTSPSFLCEDILSFDLTSASYIYFYALCLNDKDFDQMIERFKKLKKGTKIITVSFSLSEYSPHFKTLYSQKARFAWGKTEFFLNTLLN